MDTLIALDSDNIKVHDLTALVNSENVTLVALANSKWKLPKVGKKWYGSLVPVAKNSSDFRIVATITSYHR